MGSRGPITWLEYGGFLRHLHDEANEFLLSRGLDNHLPALPCRRLYVSLRRRVRLRVRVDHDLDVVSQVRLPVDLDQVGQGCRWTIASPFVDDAFADLVVHPVSPSLFGREVAFKVITRFSNCGKGRGGQARCDHAAIGMPPAVSQVEGYLRKRESLSPSKPEGWTPQASSRRPRLFPRDVSPQIPVKLGLPSATIQTRLLSGPPLPECQPPVPIPRFSSSFKASPVRSSLST